MPYPAEMVEPMRRELTDLGVREILTPEDADAVLGHRTGSTLVLVNSVCGCAAGAARPGLIEALQHAVRPDRVLTVFAGVDVEATARVRSYYSSFRPTSPQFALFRDGALVQLIQRNQIEGKSAEEVAQLLRDAFEKHCGTQKPAA